MKNRYILRAVKYFIFIAVFFCIVMAILFYTSKHPNVQYPWDLLRGNWKQLVIFMAAISVVYPLVGYWKKEIAVGEDFLSRKPLIISTLKDVHFEPAGEADSKLVFHHRSFFIRLMRLFEDTVTIEYKEGFATISGIRKDVVRISNNLEWALSRAKEQEGGAN